MYLTQIDPKGKNLQFQRGNCEFLACALHDAYDYQAIALVQVTRESKNPVSTEELLAMSYDEYSEYGDSCDFADSVNLIHCFSSFQLNDKTYYVDSLGITDDINDILRNFDYFYQNAPRDDFQLISFENPHDIQQRHWSTFYDWFSDDDFEQQTEEYRVKPAQAFVQKYGDLLTIEPPQRLEDLIAAAQGGIADTHTAGKQRSDKEDR